MALEFSICDAQWERYRKFAENPQAREWLKFQAARGLAANTVETYGRDLDSYLGFLASQSIELCLRIRVSPALDSGSDTDSRESRRNRTPSEEQNWR